LKEENQSMIGATFYCIEGTAFEMHGMQLGRVK